MALIFESSVNIGNTGTWTLTTAELPSTLSFQGVSGVVSRYRGMNGSMHALDAHTEGFKCQCTMYWSQCTDATLSLIGAVALTGSNGVRISCDWGTFQALYLPATFTYQRYLDDINTASISFLEVETT